MIRSTPHGNTMTLDLAKIAIKAEELGKDNITDFLAVSCSSTDYVGHQYGPNSIEAEDTYLRLDKDLEEFFNYLDQTVGKGNYLFFISADHGAAHAPGFAFIGFIVCSTHSIRINRIQGIPVLLIEFISHF